MAMDSLTFHPLSITKEGDDFIICQQIGGDAEDLVTIRLNEDQADQIAKFLRKPVQRNTDAAADLAGFEGFWAEYPNKTGKARAAKLWGIKGCAAQAESVMRHLRAVKQTEQWTKDDAKFVPHAATYLNQERYADEVESEDYAAYQ